MATTKKQYGWKHVIILSIIVLLFTWWMHKPEQEAAVGRAVNATATANR